VSLVQITAPSRFRVPQYRAMKQTIDEMVGRIVGRFTASGRSPLIYLYDSFDHEHLAAYYLAADVALVTPLRDGMNLVAKEYVAAQAGSDGVLVLSEFAGAAHELIEAVQVNPYEPTSSHTVSPPPSRCPPTNAAAAWPRCWSACASTTCIGGPRPSSFYCRGTSRSRCSAPPRPA
jgi:hypothetical protein